MEKRGSRELFYAAIAVVYITLFYLVMNFFLDGVPAASSFYGHSMGVVGFILMLMTETLYSLRKRARRARWGKMSTWLQFHIFTGIVGPYLVLLHSSWKFQGVAGVLTLMTGIIVLSGFIGRYIYTSVPRTSEGIALEAEELERQIALADRQLLAFSSAAGQPVPAFVGIEPGGQGQVTARIDIPALTARRDALLRQARALQTTRRLLATWHTIHIPLGLGLFALAFVHIGAAIYYATLLR